jgi:hypothetical protein
MVPEGKQTLNSRVKPEQEKAARQLVHREFRTYLASGRQADNAYDPEYSK